MADNGWMNMPEDKSLPAKPNLEHLKRQAKDLRKAYRANPRTPEILERLAAVESPRHQPDPDDPRSFTILDAQRVVAREYGFPSWPALKREVERRTMSLDEKVTEFIRAAADQHPGRALALLEDTPEIAGHSFYTQLILGDVDGVRRRLENDPALAKRAGGPYENWYPLHYVAVSVLHRDSTERAAKLREVAKLLIEHGADVNAEFREPAWPDSPLRPLYFATGRTDHAEMGRLLLAHGAEINDGESIYHAAEHMNRGCLEMLREHGVSLGLHQPWGNTPLYFLLGYREAHGNAEKATEGALWLLENGSDPNILCEPIGDAALHVAVRSFRRLPLIRALLEAGADPNLPDRENRTPYDLAIALGRGDVRKLLADFGGRRDAPLTPKEQFLSACFTADREEALRLREAHPEILETLTERERYLIVEAATEGFTDTVTTMLDAGFDINFKGTQEWGATPLHWASWYGQTETVLLLLERGADIRALANPPEDSAPFVWAIHGSGNCRNPRGDYPTIVQVFLAKGATPWEGAVNMAGEEVAELLWKYLD